MLSNGFSLTRLSDLTADQLQALLVRGAWYAKNYRTPKAYNECLQGKSVVAVFQQPSTRTRISFSLAAHQLGAYFYALDRSGSHIERGEPLSDIARVAGGVADLVVLRTAQHSDLLEFCQACPVPVINALTNENHPTQLLADLITVHESFPDLASLTDTPDWSSLKVAWVGDGNNMCTSWIEAARLLNFELHIASPKGYEPPSIKVGDEHLSCDADNPNIKFSRDPNKACANAHVLSTDVWTSMADSDAERRRLDFKGYSINAELLEYGCKDAIVLHCLPAHRDEEITDEVLNHPKASRVWRQAEMRLHAQKALLELMLVK